MQVNNTLQQASPRTISPSRGQKRPVPSSNPVTSEIPTGEIDFNKLEAPIQNQWQKPAIMDEQTEELLTNGEKQIIDLMFNITEDTGRNSYGPRKPRPVPIGNFIDLRG